MKQEENIFVVAALLSIALAALAITGWIVYKNGPTEPLNTLIMIAGSVVSGLVGYLAKGAVSAMGKDKPGGTGQAGRARMVVIVIMALTCMGGATLSGFTGCANNQTATQQIMSETSDPLAITRAVYLDARRWYNDAQQTFIDSRAALSDEKQRQYNDLLDDIGLALDVWGDSLALGKLYDLDKEEFRKAKNKLIDAGFILLAGD